MYLFEIATRVIDFHSFSNLWYWIALAVIWSRISQVILGVPWDMMTRLQRHRRSAGRLAERGIAPRPEDLQLGQQLGDDILHLIDIHSRRLTGIARAGGPLLAGIIGLTLGIGWTLGFGYGLHFAQAVALLLTPMLFVGLLNLRAAKAVSSGRLDDAGVLQELRRLRTWTQGIGICSIFLTSMWGMYQNLATSVLGN